MGHSPRIIRASLFVSVLLGVLDAGVAALVFTSIIQEWSVSYQWGIWVITLYLFMLFISMPLIRAWSNRVGRQAVLSICLALYGLGAITSGFASEFFILLMGRMVQGIGGGGLLQLASTKFSRLSMLRRLGSVSAVLPPILCGILAFVLGSILVGALGWRSVFYVQAVCALSVSLLIWRRPEKADDPPQPFDFFGMLLLASIVLCLIVGLTLIQPDQISASLVRQGVLPWFVASLGLVIPFIVAERHHDHPLIPLHMFKEQATVFVLMTSLFSGTGWVALIFIPAFAENLLRLEAGRGGLMLSIVGIGIFVSTGIYELLVERFGEMTMITSGFLVTACGFLWMGTIVNEWWGCVFAAIMIGLGLGSMIRVPFRHLLPGEREEPIRHVIRHFRMIGMTISPAILVVFLTQAVNQIPGKVRESLVATSPSAKEVSSGIFADLVMGSSQFIIPDAEKIRELIPQHIAMSTQELILRQIMRVMRETLSGGYQNVFVVTTIFMLIGFVCAMVCVRLEQDGNEEKPLDN